MLSDKESKDRHVLPDDRPGKQALLVDDGIGMHRALTQGNGLVLGMSTVARIAWVEQRETTLNRGGRPRV